MMQIKFKVINEDGIIVGYESWDKHFGWTHTIRNDRPSEDGTPIVRTGIIVDGIDRLERRQLTSVIDKDKKEIYYLDYIEVDKSRFEDGKSRIYQMIWNKNQYGWRLNLETNVKISQKHIKVIEK